MLVKRADKPRYWVAYLLPDLEVDDTFKPDVLHLTIVPWFVTEMEDDEVVKSFYSQFSTELSFDIKVGPIDEFKHRRKILINPVEPSPEVLALHQETLDWMGELDARWAVKKPHVGAEYIPHVRRRAGSHNLTEGDVFSISSLSLIRAHRRGDDQRTVAAKVDLR